MKSAMIVATCILLGSSLAVSEPIQVKQGGKSVLFEIKPGDTARSLDFWFKSPGNITNTLQVGVAGPAGIRGKLQAKGYVKFSIAAVSSEAGWYTMKSNKPIVIKADPPSQSSSSSETSSSSQPSIDCSWLTDDVYEELKDMYLQSTGKIYSREEVCALMSGVGSSGISSSSDSSLSTQDVVVAAYLRKNTCDSRLKGYVVRLRLDLAEVDPALFTTGFTVEVAMNEIIYRGQKASSLKPKSDGRFYPQPLFLISSTGYTADGKKEDVSLYRWARGAPKYLLSLEIYSYMYYRGYTLARIVASRAMLGGKATLEITNGANIYSACYELTRRRQSRYGYPK